MNKERILALADLIEKQPHTGEADLSGFNMEWLTHDCGTPSCIAGWAAWENDGRPSKMDVDWGFYAVENRAATWMGFAEITEGLSESEDQTFLLFYPQNPYDDYHSITPSHAAAVLRNLAETGEVNWDIQP